MERIEIKFRRTKEFVISILALIFLVCGIGIIVTAETGNHKIIGWSVLTACGGLFGLILKKFFFTAPRLIIIDDEGIEDTSLGVGRISWKDIETAYPNNISTNKFICLKIAEVEKYLNRLPKLSRVMALANRGYDFEEFNLQLIGSTVSQEYILDQIKSRISSDRQKFSNPEKTEMNEAVSPNFGKDGKT